MLGIGLAAMRDVASFFRYEARDDAGTPNPVAGQMSWAIGHGTSQSGNALKTFLLQGFNQDEAGRIVFDGANPHIAGRLTAVNVRFGLPSGSGTLYEPGGEGVLWWSPYRDDARGRAQAEPARSLPGLQHLPEDLRDLRLGRIQCTAVHGRADRHGQQGRPASAERRAALLLSRARRTAVMSRAASCTRRQLRRDACWREIRIPRRSRWPRSRRRWCNGSFGASNRRPAASRACLPAISRRTARRRWAGRRSPVRPCRTEWRWA